MISCSKSRFPACIRPAALTWCVARSGNHSGSMSGASSYEGLSTTPETELSMSPISTSSQSSVSAPSLHEQWSNAMPQSAGYDTYFPVTAPQEHAVFHKTYHIGN